MKQEIQTVYFDSLIDDFGIWQHTDGENILRQEGYALDDAARGLLATLALGEIGESEVLWSYLMKSRSDSGFYGFATESQEFILSIASDDATGQTLWAAGYALSKKFHPDQAKSLIADLNMYFDNFAYFRGHAYALLGAIYINKGIAKHYYSKLQKFLKDSTDEWPWPEPSLTYGNGILPYALIRYGIKYNDSEAITTGRKILEFLEERCTCNRKRGPIGNDDWLPRGSDDIPEFSQQPIDAAYMIWAWLAAFEASKNPDDKNRAELWMNWFEGDNILNTKMYDPQTNKCFDGINPDGVNYHSGAESNICLLLSKYMLQTERTI